MPTEVRTLLRPGWLVLAVFVLCLSRAALRDRRVAAVDAEPSPGRASARLADRDEKGSAQRNGQAGEILPAENLVVNGGFEEPSGISPWYYVRWGQVVEASDAPQGCRCMRFESRMPGLEAQAQQTFRLDGRRLFAVRLSASVRGEELAPGQSFEQQAVCQVAFYDEGHKPVGGGRLGPWQGTFDWTRHEVVLPVPRRARVAIVWIGLMGGTGQVWFDEVAIEPVEVNPSIFTPP